MKFIKCFFISLIMLLTACSTNTVLLERANQIEVIEQDSNQLQLLGYVSVEEIESKYNESLMIDKLKIKAASQFKEPNLKLANIKSEKIKKHLPLTWRKNSCLKRSHGHLNRGDQLNISPKHLEAIECFAGVEDSLNIRTYVKVVADVVVKN